MHGSGEQKTDNNTQTKIQKMAKKITNSKGNKSFFIMSNIMNFISIESLFYVEWHATKRDFIFYCLTSAYQLKETHAFSHWNYSQNLARIFVCAGDARRTIFLVQLAHYVRRGGLTELLISIQYILYSEISRCQCSWKWTRLLMYCHVRTVKSRQVADDGCRELATDYFGGKQFCIEIKSLIHNHKNKQTYTKMKILCIKKNVQIIIFQNTFYMS